ncbi:MAG: signal recognition particle receptor subunit alpha [Deltaproteobacteria bacterium]|nr:signal recognition particle receptor subunit alpha [Myxococcales bacterium]MDP3213071.1 signal recognition particle receptor subunit alpha [Deltaproteobacteria bacterium]
MFKTLTEGFRKARQKLTGVAELTEADIEAALRDVRLSLLEADVELNVTRRFLGRVKEKMLGQVVKLRAEAQGKKATITPDQLFVKACQDELVAMMSSPDGAQLTEAPKGTLHLHCIMATKAIYRTLDGSPPRRSEREGSRGAELVA